MQTTVSTCDDPSSVMKPPPLDSELESFLEGVEDFYDPCSLFLLLNQDRVQCATIRTSPSQTDSRPQKPVVAAVVSDDESMTHSNDDRMDALDPLMDQELFNTGIASAQSLDAEKINTDFLLDGMEDMFDPWLAPGAPRPSEKKTIANMETYEAFAEEKSFLGLNMSSENAGSNDDEMLISIDDNANTQMQQDNNPGLVPAGDSTEQWMDTR